MKGYVKPNITFQSLNMATTVSTGCSVESNYAPSQCPVEVPGQSGLTIFPEGSECMAYVPGYEDKICYHVPMADMNIFES